MREIKFRAWDKEEKIMLYNVEKTYDFGCKSDNNVPAHSFAEILEDENYVVMQFTGLYDKNKTPIYEGDIVKTIYGFKYVVEFKTERAGFYPFACGDGCGCCEIETWSANCSEIIGNIYENPDLLGE